MPRTRPKTKPFSRRVFIHRLTFFGGGVVLIGGAACKLEGSGAKSKPPAPPPSASASASPHLTFTPDEFAIVSAACERIIPRDQDPGALDVGIPVYIDRMLSTPEMTRVKDEFLAGTAAMNRRSQRMFQKPFQDAAPAEQDDLLGIFKDSAPGTGEEHYFELLVTFTLEGLLGDPSYGGNKNRAGWALVGFGTSEPPESYDGSKQLHAHGRK